MMDKLYSRLAILESEIQKAQNAVANATANLHMLMGGREEIKQMLKAEEEAAQLAAQQAGN